MSKTMKYMKEIVVLFLVPLVVIVGIAGAAIRTYNNSGVKLSCEPGIVLGYISTSQAAIYDAYKGYQGAFGPYNKSYVVVRGESGTEKLYEVGWKNGWSGPETISTAWLCVNDATNPLNQKGV